MVDLLSFVVFFLSCGGARWPSDSLNIFDCLFNNGVGL